jgi:hypothetical protein
MVCRFSTHIIDYTFQPNITSGARFGYKYQAGTFIYRLDETTTVYAPTFPLDSQVLVHSHSPPHVATIIGTPTYSRPDIYTVQFKDNSIADYSLSDNLLEAVTVPSPKSNKLFPKWIKGGAPATLFLYDMPKPRLGRLYSDDKDTWYFCLGKSSDISKGILLQDFHANYRSLLDSGQLFQGHTKFHKVYQARNQAQLQDCILRHVSAHGHRSLIAPSSLRQISKMHPSDQIIWNEAYKEEYDGLINIPTWEVLSESQFKLLSKGAKPLPSMAISTIKYDENNRPNRAKYRIVVLGNLDYSINGQENLPPPLLCLN